MLSKRKGCIFGEGSENMERLTFGLVQSISESLGYLGIGNGMPKGLIWVLLIIVSLVILFVLVLCLYIGHAKLMAAIHRIKMRKGRKWSSVLRKSQRPSFEDQFDELFARS